MSASSIDSHHRSSSSTLSGSANFKHHHHAAAADHHEDVGNNSSSGDDEDDGMNNVGLHGGELDDPSLPRPGTYLPSNCSMCVRREELRQRSLEVIKDQILNKLGMKSAPNMTGRLAPRIPPLDHLLDLYGMQGDAPGGGPHSSPFRPGPVYDEEEDDFHARTEKVIAFAQPRESLLLRHMSLSCTVLYVRMFISNVLKIANRISRSCHS